MIVSGISDPHRGCARQPITLAVSVVSFTELKQRRDLELIMLPGIGAV